MKELLAKRVQSLRTRKKWSQMDLAKAAGIPQSTISDVEAQKRIPRGDSLSKIALALGTTTSYLLGETKKAS